MLSSRKIFLLLSLLIFPSLLGCAFMNSLYNGWVSYKKAEKTEERMLEQGADTSEILAETSKDLQRAIDKAQKAIDYYPKAGRAHDDAYYLKGIASFKKQDYSSATFAFETLQNRYPQSKYYPASWLWVGKSYAANEQYLEAEVALAYLVSTYPEYLDHEEVMMLRADIALNLKGKGEAIKLLEERLAQTTDPMHRLYLIDRLGSLFLELQQYQKAVDVLEQIPPFDRKHTALFFSAQYNLARGYNFLQRYDEVAQLLDAMSNNNRYYTHRDKLQLFSGKVYLKQESYDEAEHILLRLANGSGDSEYRGEAWYLVSTISIDIRADLDRGQSELEKAAKLVVEPSLRAKIDDRLASLILLAQLQDTLLNGNPDSTDYLATKYKIGEIYWLDSRLPDSALVYFDEILSDPDAPDSLRSSALYAKALIVKSFKDDTLSAIALFEQVIEEYPAKEVAKQSQIELGIDVTVVTRSDSAWVAFTDAEDLREITDGYSKDVYYAYLVSALKYPDVVEVGARGLYAAGLVANERYHGEDGTLDTATVKIFTRLCDKYPESDQCKEIEFKLSDEAVKSYSLAYKAGQAADSTDEFAGDTVQIDTLQGALVPTESDISIDGAPELPDFQSWF